MPGHLIHIGFPKAGSTFLQKWFELHPQLFYSPGGLGGFYNVYDISRKACQNANDNFMYFVTSDESLSTPFFSTGTIPVEFGLKDHTAFQPDGMVQKKVCNTLKCLYPNGKILLTTRGFKGLMMSTYSQYVRVGGIRTFEEFAEISASSIKDQADKNEDGGGLDFTFIANIYEEAFGKENVIILPFELLRDDQSKFLSVIETQLQLPHFKVTIDKLNESLSPEELYWYPRISSLVSAIALRFGEKRYAKIYRWYVGKTLKNKFRAVVKILSRVKPNGRITNANFNVGVWDFQEEYFERLSAKLRNDPMYAPYLREYFFVP